MSPQDIHKSAEIKAANGKSVKAVTVFAHALRFFKGHALEELSDQSATSILEEDIQWVLTVPAIWRAPAKQFMRTAAYEVRKQLVNVFSLLLYTLSNFKAREKFEIFLRVVSDNFFILFTKVLVWL